jgi:hypothetical protein
MAGDSLSKESSLRAFPKYLLLEHIIVIYYKVIVKQTHLCALKGLNHLAWPMNSSLAYKHGRRFTIAETSYSEKSYLSTVSHIKCLLQQITHGI